MKRDPNNTSISFETEGEKETSEQIKNAYESGVIEQPFDESFTQDQAEKADEV